MGFSSIDIVGSDAASDLNATVRKQFRKKVPLDQIVRELVVEVDQDHGDHNTHGCINVALVLTDGGAAAKLAATDGFVELVMHTYRRLRTVLQLTAAYEGEDFDPEGQYCRRYREILRELAQFIPPEIRPWQRGVPRQAGRYWGFALDGDMMVVDVQIRAYGIAVRNDAGSTLGVIGTGPAMLTDEQFAPVFAYFKPWTKDRPKPPTAEEL